jgi:hypothetical protein
MFMGVVSVVSLGVKLLSLGSLNEQSIAICVGLLVGELHSDLLRLGWLVLGVDVLLHGKLLLDCLGWQRGRCFQRFTFHSRLLRLVPLHVVLLGHDVRVLGGGEGGGGSELLVVVGEGVGDGVELLVVGGEGVGVGEHLVVVSEGVGDGVELLVVGGEGVGVGEHLVVVSEGVGDGVELLVVGGEGVGKLLVVVVGGEGGGGELLGNFVLDSSFLFHFFTSPSA